MRSRRQVFGHLGRNGRQLGRGWGGLFGPVIRFITGLFRRGAPVARKIIASKAVRSGASQIAKKIGKMGAKKIEHLIDKSAPPPDLSQDMKDVARSVKKTAKRTLHEITADKKPLVKKKKRPAKAAKIRQDLW